MQTGRLRERIKLQRQAIEVQPSGYEKETWTTFATVWASVRSGASGERFRSQADQEQATVTHTVRIRYKAGLFVTQRILWGKRVLDVHSMIDPDGKNHELVLLCEEFFPGETITPTFSTPAPTPLASDGFASAFGTTDGAGHSGTPAGGGLTWSTQSGGWTVESSKAKATAQPAIATVDVGVADVLIDGDIDRGGAHGGLVARYVDANNYIYAYVDGTNVVAIRKLAGVLSTLLASSSIPYVAGAKMRMVVEGNNLTLYYNDTLVGTSAGVSSSLNGTLHGIYATSITTTVDDFAVFRSSALGSV